MDKSILCAVDFSDSSRAVLTFAVDLSRQFHNHLTVLFTYRLLNLPTDEALVLRKKMEEKALQNFAILEKEVLGNSGVSYDFKVEVGFISNRVKEYSRKNEVSFLVMGKNMNTSSKESFDELSANLQIPILIVP